MKIISNDNMLTGLGEKLYSFCIKFGLDPESSRKISFWTKLIGQIRLGVISTKLPSVEKLVVNVNGYSSCGK